MFVLLVSVLSLVTRAIKCLFVFGVCAISLWRVQGNFAQHMFIDPKRRFDNFGLAFNFVNHWGNQRTFNDGYHIIHHMNSLLHWSKIPQWFEDHIELFAIRESIVFNGVDTMEVRKRGLLVGVLRGCSDPSASRDWLFSTLLPVL